jgi:hypothetical protein
VLKQGPSKQFPYNRYATKKTLAKGLLDISLLLANASQLKTLLTAGEAVNRTFFWPVLVMIVLSILLQVTTGLVLLVLGSMEVKKPEDKKRVNAINNSTVGLIFVITILNVFIAGFGMKLTDTPTP